MNQLIGIIGNTLYIEPFYVGDHAHEATISNQTKVELIERGVKEYLSYDYIEAILHGLRYEDYLIMLEKNKED